MIEFILSTAMKRQRRSTAIAILFALVAAVAGVVLLAVSGWFLTGAALAGLGGMAAVQVFNSSPPMRGFGASPLRARSAAMASACSVTAQRRLRSLMYVPHCSDGWLKRSLRGPSPGLRAKSQHSLAAMLMPWKTRWCVKLPRQGQWRRHLRACLLLLCPGLPLRLPC